MVAEPQRQPWAVALDRFLAQIREKRAILCLALLFALFLALALLVRADVLGKVDRTVTLGLQRSRNPFLDAVAIGFTFCGNTVTLITLGLGAVGIFLARRCRWAALLTAATLLGVPFDMLLKTLVDRPRPGASVVEVILPAGGLSFPSGHAMASCMFYGFMAVMCWVHVRHATARGFWTGFLTLLAAGIGISRIYLGAHWFSDVLGGWAAGLFFLLLLTESYKLVGDAELAGRKHEGLQCKMSS